MAYKHNIFQHLHVDECKDDDHSNKDKELRMAIKKLNEIEKLKKKDVLNQQEKEKITREAYYRNIVKPNADVQNGFENMSKKRKERLGEYCCDICFEDKDVCIRLDNHRIKHTFRLLKKKEGDNYTDSCNCRILICDYLFFLYVIIRFKSPLCIMYILYFYVFFLSKSNGEKPFNFLMVMVDLHKYKAK